MLQWDTNYTDCLVMTYLFTNWNIIEVRCYARLLVDFFFLTLKICCYKWLQVYYLYICKLHFIHSRITNLINTDPINKLVSDFIVYRLLTQDCERNPTELIRECLKLKKYLQTDFTLARKVIHCVSMLHSSHSTFTLYEFTNADHTQLL